MQETTLDERVAGEVRAELARQRRTQQWLSDQTGIGRPSLNKRLNGTRPFTVAELNKVAQALGVQVVTLLEPAA